MLRILLLPLILFSLQLTACSTPPTDEPLPEPGPDTLRNLRLLALGDSYTIGESVAVPERWPNQLADSLRKEAVLVDSVKIIATTGWRTDQLMAAINQQSPDSAWNLVGLLIGVNNQFQGRSLSVYETEFEDLLNRAIALAGGDRSKVFVISIPDYAYTPYGQANNQQQISAGIDQFNAANRSITESYGIAYYNITPISREGIDKPEYVASDGLHPSGIQYGQWVSSFYREIATGLR